MDLVPCLTAAQVEAAGTVAGALATTAAAFLAWKTARAMVETERDRRHDELTPDLGISLGPVPSEGDRMVLEVALKGPPGLLRLDSIWITVLDENAAEESAGDDVVAPYRFAPDNEGVDRDGRRQIAGRLLRGIPATFDLEPTRVDGTWYNPIRLAFACRTNGIKPWLVVHEIPAPLVEWEITLERTDDGSHSQEFDGNTRLILRNIGSAIACGAQLVMEPDLVQRYGYEWDPLSMRDGGAQDVHPGEVRSIGLTCSDDEDDNHRKVILEWRERGMHRDLEIDLNLM